MLRTEDATDVAKLKKKGVMWGGRSPWGASKIGVSKVGGTMRNGSPEGAVTKGGTLGGGNGVAPVGEPTPKAVGIVEGGGDSCAQGEGGGSKIEAPTDVGSGTTESAEGGCGGSGSGEVRIGATGKDDMALPLSPEKKIAPKTRSKNKEKSLTNLGTSANEDAHPKD